MSWRNDLRDLLDAIAYGVLCAPDEFPAEDYLRPEEQMNFPRYSDELRDRLEKLEPHLTDVVDFPACKTLLEESLALYSSGERNPAAWKLQELDDILRSIRR